ncbi:hypothetical protein CAEBREN_18257 [Caenorhabditis brenneri]|uniref:SPK domain-containing protein n=1 Tax=Caenorhabditis brenneri TaxID=135651 RepID=G0NSX8_CAEBE|nr:hypothetical protein CAEBREN_18257 [Caenorhabditis brenneri]
MTRKNLPDGIKILRYIVVHQWDAPGPIPFHDLHEGWFQNGGYAVKYKKLNVKKTCRSNRRVDVESRLKKIDKLNFFTNEQKVHLLWILSWPMNEEFETILKNEGHQFELTEPQRLIAFFRSRDGNFERRSPRQLQPTGSYPETPKNEEMDAMELNQQNQNDSLIEPQARTPQEPPKLLFSQMRLTHAMRMLQWFSKNSWNITTPIHSSIVCQCWLAKIKPSKLQKSNMKVKRDRLEATMSNPESLPGFTTEQKVQLLFVLSLPVNEAFETILKNEGHEVELSDPKRLITFFRSRDGNMERRATLQEHQGVYEQAEEQLDDNSVIYEDIDFSRYFKQGGIVKDEPQEDYYGGMDAEYSHQGTGDMAGPSEEYNQVGMKQEPHHQDDVNALREYGQQNIKDEPGPSDDGSSLIREIKLEPGELVNIAVGHPSPPEFYAPPSPINPVPSISGSLRILRASVMALRAPGLEKTQNAIEEAIRIHGFNINPVPIANVVSKLSPIGFFVMQGNPRSEQERQMSRKAYLQFFLQFLILLNSNQLDDYQDEIASKIDQLDDSAKIRIDSVKHGLNTLLKAIIS